MANILCRTKGGTDPAGKPRVYFTCHPEDFGLYFDRVCQDIFQTHDCAIFYTEDMTASIAEQDKSTDLESNNLFVVPVTFKLLTEPCRAMDGDLAYAMEKNIPILPFMMEPGIRDLYVKKFGARHSLSPFSTDETEIAYGEKLKKFLEAVLVSDKLAKRIRGAFDAYIFLSYRKKDRRYANELMKQIHSYPELRDWAIWYDEFLTPSENYRKNIRKMLGKSKLFALLVTPNVLEEPNGKPNFVMGVEYPAAHKAGKVVLPAEMEKTNHTLLSKKFADLTSCVDPHKDAFRNRLLKAAAKADVSKKKDTPRHQFLIGMAYLEGIDVEIDREKGMALILAAAEKGFPEAMEKAYNIYEARGEYAQAGHWADRLADYYTKRFGPEHPDTMNWEENRAYICGCSGQYRQAKTMLENAYPIRCRISGAESKDALTILHNLSWLYDRLGDDLQAMETCDRVYALRRRLKGENDPDTLMSLSQLVKIYCALGESRTALAFCQWVYDQRKLILGEEHPNTLVSLNDLAICYGREGKPGYEQDLLLQAYNTRRRISGEKHPETLTCLNNLGAGYGAMNKSQEAYDLRKEVLGEKHPQTLESLTNLAMAYYDAGDYQMAASLAARAFYGLCEAVGETHASTINAADMLAGIYYREDDEMQRKYWEEMTERLRSQVPEDPILPRMFKIMEETELSSDYLEKIFAAAGKTWEETHPSTLFWANRLAEQCNCTGLWEKEARLWETAYRIGCKIFGEDHPYNLDTLVRLAGAYDRMGDKDSAVFTQQKIYEIRCSQEDEHTRMAAANEHASTCYLVGDYARALELYQQAHMLYQKLYQRENVLFFGDFAHTYKALGDYKEALYWFNRLYTYWSTALGEDNVATVDSMEQMAEIQEILGNHQEVLHWREKIWLVQKKNWNPEHTNYRTAAKKLRAVRMAMQLCWYCGGRFNEKGVCTKCGKPRDY